MSGYLPHWLWRSSWGGEGNRQSGRTQSVAVESENGIHVDCKEAGRNSSDEAETTPKASASKADGAVPSFTLSVDDRYEEETGSPFKHAAPSFPAANRPQRGSALPQSFRPAATSSPNSSSLMPPPARPTSTARRLAPSAAVSLRVPTAGPLPDRGPPANSQQRVSTSPSLNPTTTTTNSRGKVLLKPGHSPMDWAALIRSPSSNLSGVITFQRVTPAQLRKMSGRKGKPAWSSWQGKVYNITPYVNFHPGGGPEIMKAAGRDGEKLFMEVHPWVNWENMLGSCLVGVMVPEGYYESTGKKIGSELEELD